MRGREGGRERGKEGGRGEKGEGRREGGRKGGERGREEGRRTELCDFFAAITCLHMYSTHCQCCTVAYQLEFLLPGWYLLVYMTQRAYAESV